MKSSFLKMAGTAAMTILSIVTLAGIAVTAQETANTPQAENLSPEGGLGSFHRDLEGTWDVQVTIRNCQNGAPIKTFPSVTTFFFGGEAMDSSSGAPQAAKTPAHGTWWNLGGRRYHFKFKHFNFDAGGNATGWAVVTQDVDMNRRGTAYESEGFAQFYNMSGDLLSTGCSSTTAVRF